MLLRLIVRDGFHHAFRPLLVDMLTVLAINLIGEGLNDALNPRLKQR